MDNVYFKLYELSTRLNDALGPDGAINSFRVVALDLIEEIFEYRGITITIISENNDSLTDKHYLNTVVRGISQSVLLEFYNEHADRGIIHEGSILLVAISIYDVMPKEELVKTKFFTDFCVPNNLLDQIIVGLYNEDKLFGYITLINTNDEGYFTDHDRDVLNAIKRIFEPIVNRIRKYDALNTKYRLLKRYAKLFKVGQIVMNSHHKIEYMDEQGKHFMHDITGFEQRNFEFYLANHIFRNERKLANEDHVLLNVDNYQIRIDKLSTNLNAIQNNQGDHYYINIVERLEGKSTSFKSIKDRFLLTDREMQIVNVIKDGMTNKEISDLLSIR